MIWNQVLNRLPREFVDASSLEVFKFVAQPNCQQLLASRWYDEFPGWRRRHWAVKMLTCVVIGLLFPVFSVCYLIAPKSPLGLFIRKPFIKFICHTASYLTFLFLLLLASQHIDRSDLSMQGPPPTIVEWMILPWVLVSGKIGPPVDDRIIALEMLVSFQRGFIWGEIKQMWDGGLQDYIHDWWNLMDFVMNSLYLATISLKIVAFSKAHVFPVLMMPELNADEVSPQWSGGTEPPPLTCWPHFLDMVGFLGCEHTVLAHVQLHIHQYSNSSPHNPFSPQPVLVLGAALTQVQDFTLSLVKPHVVSVDPFLVLVHVPLDGMLPFWHVNCTTQLVIIRRLAQGALNTSVHVIDEDIKLFWSQHRSLRDTTCH
ncbi:hypothetical protein WISP_117158 [Willisornis vidua]|uniref:Ion transport domain-containing protein n=1 Tax=Willisornis vidua TaxID=1566151 RepID=A0ABQ9CTM4_9PASS|nr:hypothetical protein WISP_117158 [Willisornis vidua]